MQDTNQSEEIPAPGAKKASILSRLVTRFGMKRLIIALVVILFALWVIKVVMGWFGGPAATHAPVAVRQVASPADSGDDMHATASSTSTPPDMHRASEGTPRDAHSPNTTATAQLPVRSPSATSDHGTAVDGHGAAPKSYDTTADGHGGGAASRQMASQPGTDHGVSDRRVPAVRGVAFVNAVVKPLNYELNERFWGWRPNDILNFTDNVNNFQLGVLEVTRRTAVILAERISRTGSTAAFDRELENAMNWLMIRPEQYWFPSPESMYGDALEAMQNYKRRLVDRAAYFYTRTDNLIPLLMAYEDLLGSSDENLVKHEEANGEHVSFFKSDDYFFYAKGVASALHPILEAIAIDFEKTLEARRGMEVIHHAIESLEYAMAIDPLVITNSDLSGILANHRANMAAPISHARFYIGVLIKTLST